MKDLNPTAVIFWGLCGIIGYFVNGSDGALAGVGIGLFVSLVVDVYSGRVKQ